MSTTLVERYVATRPFVRMELQLAREAIARPGWLTPRQDAALRYALALARVHVVDGPDGSPVEIGGALAKYRGIVHDTLAPFLNENEGLTDAAGLLAQVPALTALARGTRDSVLAGFASRLSRERLEQEISQPYLVLATGGGGGAGYVFVGAFAALEERGLRPALICGTSIGAAVGAFRARTREFELATHLEVARNLRWPRVLRPAKVRSRFGLPAALRLYLRGSIGEHFVRPDGEVMRLSDLPISLLTVVTGLRRGALTHDIDYYEHLLEMGSDERRQPRLGTVRGKIREITRSVGDLLGRAGQLRELVLGATDATREFDVIDAVGFSCAVPGVLHYDIVRHDPRMERLVEELLTRHGLFRLVDGGVVNNVPARPAWEAVQNGRLGSRNAFILALDCFAPRLTANPLWLPAQRLVQANVRKNRPFAQVYKAFHWTLSPMELVPNLDHFMAAVRRGRRELEAELGRITRLLAPIPGLDMEYSAQPLPALDLSWRSVPSA